ncbi:hypothetical protein DERF_009675 [Dermatophagoides farinae]|uniref:Uncharacterized protein n=1 Tax=Dermatophagoides farinae TaxID=6954 RepID=A0A922HXS6_DERFA|nr:hypothetical protein DERF_009675 [Dermatophagoides farinae]
MDPTNIITNFNSLSISKSSQQRIVGQKFVAENVVKLFHEERLPSHHCFSRSNNHNENDNKHNETNELSLWPCLRHFTWSSLLQQQFGKFLPVDKGYSMFTIDQQENRLQLFSNGSNQGIFIGSIANKIIYSYSDSSNYLYILDEKHRLYFYPVTENSQNYHLKVLIEDIVKFRSNGKQCLALDSDGDLLVWWMIFHHDQSEHFDNIEFRPWKFQQIKEIFGEKFIILDFDCGQSNAVILACSSDYGAQAVHIWRQSFKNENDDYLETIHISYKRNFLEYYCRQPLIITKMPKINNCYNIPSTDIYIFISNNSWYIYNTQTGQQIKTSLRSLPDLYSFYGHYPSSPPSFCHINQQNCLQDPQQISILETFNNPFCYDFKIQIPMMITNQQTIIRTIYLCKAILQQWKPYFNHLFQQNPTLNETSELLLTIGYIEHYYYYKSMYTILLPTSIIHCEQIRQGIQKLEKQHEKPFIPISNTTNMSEDFDLNSIDLSDLIYN